MFRVSASRWLRFGPSRPYLQTVRYRIAKFSKSHCRFMCTSKNYVSAVHQRFFVAPFTLYRPKLTALPNPKSDPRIDGFPKNVRRGRIATLPEVIRAHNWQRAKIHRCNPRLPFTVAYCSCQRSHTICCKRRPGVRVLTR
jgi:hypothetical protein